MKNETALNEYLFDLKLRNCSPRTVRSAKNNMALFLCWLETEYNLTAIEDIKRVHIKGYLHYKQSLGLKPTYAFIFVVCVLFILSSLVTLYSSRGNILVM